MTQTLIDSAPTWVKSTYISTMKGVKQLLKASGLLAKLDQKAKTSRDYHYLRSLLAIYQIEDMIELDVPWWTYTAIEFIDAYIQQLPKPPDVFEYGSGASTIWLAKRSSRVISIEHDEQWFKQLQSEVVDYNNVRVLLKKPTLISDDKPVQSAKLKGVDFKHYVHAIDEYQTLFDLIIIDGRARSACLNAALTHLKPTGIIIFDNSERARYSDAINQSGLEILRFTGRVPGSPINSETAILRHKSHAIE